MGDIEAKDDNEAKADENIETMVNENKETEIGKIAESSKKKKDTEMTNEDLEDRETRSKSASLVSPSKSGGKRRPRGCGKCKYCLTEVNCGRCLRCKNYDRWRKMCENRLCIERRGELMHRREDVSASDPVRSPRLIAESSSADHDSPDATTPPRKEPPTMGSPDDPTASDGASASFSPVEDDDQSEQRSKEEDQSESREEKRDGKLVASKSAPSP